MDRPILQTTERASVREQLEELLGARTARETVLVARLVVGFRGKAADLLTLLEVAVAEGDADSAARYIHTLKGSSALLGALELPLVCEELESSVMATELAKIVDHPGRLAAAIERFCAVLHQQAAAMAELDGPVT